MDYDENKVYLELKKCLSSLIGGSGHLSSYYPIRDTLQIQSAKPLGSGMFEYLFTVDAFLETEFKEYTEEQEEERPDSLQGKIVLDANYKVCRNERGEVLLSPYRCLLLESPKSEPFQKKSTEKPGLLSSDDIYKLLNF
ncbi:MAG: hypothetical protein H7A25_20905 [Leptospiraceae bacterium]|nr:hypothetical protein [Leptospiraceae bacterium]MCP5502369.1 hypothetical protein [Leptospiraceae bacterium]